MGLVYMHVCAYHNMWCSCGHADLVGIVSGQSGTHAYILDASYSTPYWGQSAVHMCGLFVLEAISSHIRIFNAHTFANISTHVCVVC